jgi:hypothetical protein
MSSTLFDWKKTIHLIRGLPGEGKSTLARKLVKSRDQIIENDDFWLLPSVKEPISWIHLRNDAQLWSQADIDGMGSLDYKYERTMTHIAGYWAWAETFRRIRYYDEVVVANTFVRREFIFSYINEALRLGINVKLHRPSSVWVGDAIKCFEKSVHGVPLETVERMKSEWEECTQDEIDALINGVKEYDALVNEEKPNV